MFGDQLTEKVWPFSWIPIKVWSSDHGWSRPAHRQKCGHLRTHKNVVICSQTKLRWPITCKKGGHMLQGISKRMFDRKMLLWTKVWIFYSLSSNCNTVVPILRTNSFYSPLKVSICYWTFFLRCATLRQIKVWLPNICMTNTPSSQYLMPGIKVQQNSIVLKWAQS